MVHNGIIENHEALREQLKALGYVFTSDTDTEVIAHLLNHKLKDLRDLTVALKATVKELHGAYGLAVISAQAAGSPGRRPQWQPVGDRSGPGGKLPRVRPVGPASGH